ncbi:MAG TPA: SAM-dependent methyltransferase [Burkholderiales bacterium]|nr:SAM-dependent methyltransferase [Burkholderiales bacterium]
MSGTLYAIPSPLGGKAADALPAPALAAIRGLRAFAVENAKSARAFLADVGMPCPLQELGILDLQADSSKAMGLLKTGASLGLVSEAGCPAIADPGASLVDAAHAEGLRVVPLVGPSSIVLALMASGLEGQRFAFCGYLPREPEARRRRIRELEARSRRERETQIFIETPYRNEALLAALLQTAADTTRLCVAADLTLAGERIRTHAMPRWRSLHVEIGKRPAVFLLQAT